MARDAVAEVMPPGKRRRRAIGFVAQPSEVTAPPPHHDTRREGRHEDEAGRARDAAQPLENLHRRNGACQRADDAAPDAGFAREMEVERPRPEAADRRPRQQRHAIERPSGIDLPASRLQPPIIDEQRHAQRGTGGEKIEDGMDQHHATLHTVNSAVIPAKAGIPLWHQHATTLLGHFTTSPLSIIAGLVPAILSVAAKKMPGLNNKPGHDEREKTPAPLSGFQSPAVRWPRP